MWGYFTVFFIYLIMFKKYSIYLIFILIPVLITVCLGNSQIGKSFTSGKIIIVETENFEMEMDMEDFIPLVLMSQMSIDSPKALLKAQSVIIRTYILKCMGEADKISTGELGLPFILPESLKEFWFNQYKVNKANSISGIFANLTGIGSSYVYERNWERLHNIVLDTKSYVIKWQDELIWPLFHCVSNGKTRDGNENLGQKFSYLKSVNCYGSDEIEKDQRSVVLSVEQIKEKLQTKSIIPYTGQSEVFGKTHINPERFLELVDISNRDGAGYVMTVKIGDTLIDGQNFADALGLASTSFDMVVEGNDIKFVTTGLGHGFGMSLAYAEQLSNDGKSWKEILQIFYDGEIAYY